MGIGNKLGSGDEDECEGKQFVVGSVFMYLCVIRFGFRN